MDLDPYGALASELRAALDEAVLRRAELSRRLDRLAAIMDDLRIAFAAAEASLARSRRLRAALARARRYDTLSPSLPGFTQEALRDGT